MHKTAVIYIRVSDPSQVENNSLVTQEKICKDFAERNEYGVTKVFREEGLSGKNTNRKALKDLLFYCYQKLNKVDAVIVYKLWRFSRDTGDGLELEAYLAKKGVQVLSATEPVQDDAVGRFVKTMIYATGQLDNEIKGNIVKDNMQSLYRKGVWCWKCPVGYMRPFLTKEENKGKAPVPMPKLRTIIYSLCKEAATSLYTQQQLADRMNTRGYEEIVHETATIKTVTRILKNTFYHGKMYCKKWNEYAQGQHEPIVDEALWTKAHNAVFNTKIKYGSQSNDKYPLKGTVKCAECGRFMTSSNPRGRTKIYTHYECGNKACRRARIGTDQAYTQFMDVLSRVKPTKRAMMLFEHMVFNDWDKAINTAKEEARGIDEQVELLEDDLVKITNSHDKGFYTEEFARKKADEANARILALKVARSDLRYEQYDTEKVRNFTKYFLLHLDRLWDRLTEPAMKQALQNKIFPMGVECTRNKEIRTAGLSPSFELIKQLNASIETIGECFRKNSNLF